MYEQKFWFWATVFIVLIIVTYWQVRENISLKDKLKTIMENDSAPWPNAIQWIIHFAWIRSIQFLSLLACSALLIISYDQRIINYDQLIITNDKRHDNVEKYLLKLKSALTERDTLIQRQATIIAKDRMAMQHQQSQQASASTAAQPATAATPPVKAAPAATQPAHDSIVDVYDPEKSKTDNQSSMDEIKKRYEDIFVIHTFLKKCNKIQPVDYGIITHALSQEMALVSAPEHLKDDILASADGAYKEIYLDSPCDGQGIDALYNQYTGYIKLLSESFPQK